MMHAQTQAQGFYTRLGYSTHGETFIEENIEHIIMKKNYGMTFHRESNLI